METHYEVPSNNLYCYYAHSVYNYCLSLSVGGVGEMASKARYQAFGLCEASPRWWLRHMGNGTTVRFKGTSMYDRDELIKRRDELSAKIEKLEDIHREVLEILYEIRFHNGMMDIVDAYTNEAINKLTRY